MVNFKVSKGLMRINIFNNYCLLSINQLLSLLTMLLVNRYIKRNNTYYRFLVLSTNQLCNYLTVVSCSGSIFVGVRRRQVVGKFARPFKEVALLIWTILDHNLYTQKWSNNCFKASHPLLEIWERLCDCYLTINR